MHVYFRQSLSLNFDRSYETNFAGNKRAYTSIREYRVHRFWISRQTLHLPKIDGMTNLAYEPWNNPRHVDVPVQICDDPDAFKYPKGLICAGEPCNYFKKTIFKNNSMNFIKLCLSLLLKPNYFKKQSSLSSFYLPFYRSKMTMSTPGQFGPELLKIILFENNCTTFYTNLYELFCQFISWTNWVNSGKF